MSRSVSVVVPSLHGGTRLVDLTRASLASDGVDVEVIVVDNGMPPEAADAVRAAGGTIVRLDSNHGFGSAVNRGVERASGDALVVTNDDLVPRPEFVAELVAPLADASMVAGVLLYERSPDTIESAGIELDTALVAHDYLGGEPVSRLETPVEPPFGPCGAAAAFDVATFRDVGGFDETFFAYYEDVDLALRLRAAGAVCGLAARARALHVGSATLGTLSRSKADIVGFSRGYALRKHQVLQHATRRGAAAILAAELGTTAFLTVQHRSLGPAAARIRGWQACTPRPPSPGAPPATIGLMTGLRRRYARVRRGSR
jgi:N-acetylglucosaminyl-diphospho-decaprenol L-rhamnosyltransferase